MLLIAFLVFSIFALIQQPKHFYIHLLMIIYICAGAAVGLFAFYVPMALLELIELLPVAALFCIMLTRRRTHDQ